MKGDAVLLLSGVVVTAASGMVGLLFGRWSGLGHWITNSLAVVGAGAGLIGAVSALSGSYVHVLQLPSPIPGADFALAADWLSAFFLIPIFLISLLGSIYGLDYWRQAEHQDNGRKLRLFYGLLTAALAVLVLARNSVTFLFGWETMAVSAFFLVSTEDHDAEVREAGWLYLAASHS